LILMLRGVNVGGANRLPMAAFRGMLEGLGLLRVQTYIQSGNAVCLGTRAGLQARVADALTAFGITTPVFVLGLTEMAAVLAANPFAAEGAADGTKVHILFLEPGAALLPGLGHHATAGERFHLTEAALYLHTPQGFGTSSVAGKVGRYLKGGFTARNQRSAEAIFALARGLTPLTGT
jgi:uncharacterized protein (DUF1697 family)